MKPNLLIFLCCLILSLTFACKQNANDNKYQQSYNTWLQYKNTWNNSYKYLVTTSSWTGFSTETVVAVTNGQVTQRHFKSFKTDGGVVNEEWNEDQSTLNTHSTGAAAKTMDEIYADVKSKWIIKRDKATIYFETENNGMISLAGYREEGCQDDCFQGVRIANIEKL